MKKTTKTYEKYVGSRVVRCDTPSGKEEASSRIFWTKEEANQTYADLRDEHPDHCYQVRHFTEKVYLVEEGDDIV